MRHDVTVEIVGAEFTVKCSQYDLDERYPSRWLAVCAGHLHLAGFDPALLELASAGKADHD